MNRRPVFHRLVCLWAGVAGLCFLPQAKADLIREWNQEILAAMEAESSLTPEASRVLAMVHTAIYNAVEGIAGDHHVFANGSYTGPTSGAAYGSSMEAAAATAAWMVVQDLYPGQATSFANLYQSQINGLADDAARADGITFGYIVANDILNWRSGDGSSVAANGGLYSESGLTGRWEIPAGGSAALPGWGSVTNFGLTGTAGFTGSLPGGAEAFLQSGAYAADFNQVKELGSASSVTRTPEQTAAALFWAGTGGSGGTAGIWNQIAATMAETAGLSLQDSARLHAALNVAMADAAIVTWETKYDVDFWSPMNAVRDGDADGNGATLGEPGWTALLAELNTPSYFSEQSALSAAAATVLQSFLGDVGFTIDLDGPGGEAPRTYASLTEAAEEAGLSQIWGGVSFGSGHEDAALSGQAVAQAILDNHFAPVPEPSAMVLLMAGGLLQLLRRRR